MPADTRSDVSIGEKISETDESVYLQEAEEQILREVWKISKGNAFLECRNLESIKIPEGIQDIGEKAFEGTKWMEKKRKKSAFVIINDALIDAATLTGNVVIPAV